MRSRATWLMKLSHRSCSSSDSAARNHWRPSVSSINSYLSVARPCGWSPRFAKEPRLHARCSTERIHCEPGRLWWSRRCGSRPAIPCPTDPDARQDRGYRDRATHGGSPAASVPAYLLVLVIGQLGPIGDTPPLLPGRVETTTLVKISLHHAWRNSRPTH
jgi:hypothetical protein